MIRNILNLGTFDKQSSPRKLLEDDSSIKQLSGDGEFISSDMAADENWSQSSHSFEESPEAPQNGLINQSVNPFAPESQLFAKASAFQQDNEHNSAGVDLVSFVEIESYETLRQRVERKTRELLLAQRSLRDKESEIQRVLDDTQESNRIIFILKRDIKSLIDRIEQLQTELEEVSLEREGYQEVNCALHEQVTHIQQVLHCAQDETSKNRASMLQEENRSKDLIIESLKNENQLQKRYYASTIEDYKQIMINQEHMIQDYKFQVSLLSQRVQDLAPKFDEDHQCFEFQTWNDEDPKLIEGSSSSEEDCESIYLPPILFRQQPVIKQHAPIETWNNFVSEEVQSRKQEKRERTPKFTDNKPSNNISNEQIFSDLSSAMEENCALKKQLGKLQDALSSRFMISDF